MEDNTINNPIPDATVETDGLPQDIPAQDPGDCSGESAEHEMAGLTPVLIGGQPVFRTVQLFDASGSPVLEDGKPVFKRVQRFVKNGRHVYIVLEKVTDSTGNETYIPGLEEFAVESDLAPEAQTRAKKSIAADREKAAGASENAPAKLTAVLSPDQNCDLLTSSAYKRAGISITVLSVIMSSISTAVVYAAIFLCLVISGLSGDLSGDIGNIILGLSGESTFSVIESNITLMAFAIALGSVLGMGGGLVAERLILSNRHYEPIQKKRLGFRNFMMVTLISLGVWSLGVYIGNFADIFFPIQSSDSILDVLENSGVRSLPLHVYAVIGAPILEELACRKLLLDRLHKYGQIPAMIVSGLLFGLLHGNSGQFFLAFFLGVIFAAVYLKTGNILYTMGLHAIINFTASIPTFLSWAGVDVSGVFYFILLPLFFVAGIVLLIVKRKSDLFSLTPSVCERPAFQVYANAGMLIAMIAGTASLLVTDFMTRILGAIRYTPLNLLGLLSTLLVPVAVLAAVIVTQKASKKKDVSVSCEAEPLPGPATPE